MKSSLAVAGVLVRYTFRTTRPLSALVQEVLCPSCGSPARVTGIGPSSAPKARPYVVVEMLCATCDKYRSVFYESQESTSVLSARAARAIRRHDTDLRHERESLRESSLSSPSSAVDTNGLNAANQAQSTSNV